MKEKFSLITNFIIFLSVTFAIYCMFTGFNFMSQNNALSVADLSMFKFFTIDSNVFAGIVCMIMVVVEANCLIKKQSIPNWILVLKLMATASVTLTFIVTVFFLSPQYGENFLFLFMNANFFLHLLVPLLCIFSFILFEKSNMKFGYTFTGMIPMMSYAIYYVTNSVQHAQGNIVPKEYDWYGFFMFGLNTMWIVLGIVFIVMYIISLVLWKLNKKR